MSDTRLREQITNLMTQNLRHAGQYYYTVPSPEIYPFQWFWDSCFHAEILKHIDIDRARSELLSTTSHKLKNGLFPHIIYWRDDYKIINWGRERRGDVINQVWSDEGMSTITQPPLLAYTLLNLHRHKPDTGFLHELYPTMRNYYLSLKNTRDPQGRGLLGIINPDESGEDNSPRFDLEQGLAPGHSMNENLDRRLDRIKEYKACGENASECMSKYFWVEDVSFNTIYNVALRALAEIASEIKEISDKELFNREADQHKKAIREKLCLSSNLCYSLSGNDQVRVEINTWNIFMPLFGGILEQSEADKLVNDYLLDERLFWSQFPIPSVALNENSFENDFWRGPTWMSVNWFIYHGLVRYGYHDLAQDIKQKTTNLIGKSGFREYYDPTTGKGLGAHNFTWGGLLLDMS